MHQKSKRESLHMPVSVIQRQICVSEMAFVARERITSNWGWTGVSQRPKLYCCLFILPFFPLGYYCHLCTIHATSMLPDISYYCLNVHIHTRNSFKVKAEWCKNYAHFIFLAFQNTAWLKVTQVNICCKDANMNFSSLALWFSYENCI